MLKEGYYLKCRLKIRIMFFAPQLIFRDVDYFNGRKKRSLFFLLENYVEFVFLFNFNFSVLTLRPFENCTRGLDSFYTPPLCYGPEYSDNKKFNNLIEDYTFYTWIKKIYYYITMYAVYWQLNRIISSLSVAEMFRISFV